MKMESIPEALELIYLKKANLRRAFETLQAHSPSLSSFNLTWPDLDSHFASQISSLQRNLDLLQCQQKSPFKLSSSPVPGPARPELKSLCEKMKGLGLRNYITERPSEIITIRDELQDALRCARDPAGLVLVALDGFHDNSECDSRWSCVVLLEALAALKPAIGGGLKEKAKKLAEEWKKKTSVSVENSLACLGFLYLVAAYDLADGFDMAFLTEIAFVVVKDLEFKQAVQLCRLLSLNVPDLLSKLEMMSEKLLAVKFILEFKLTDKFPPVPILNEHVQFSKNLTDRAKKRRKGTVGLRNAATKEINSLKPVIKIIEEYQLSEYPKEELVKHIESLEKVAEMQDSAETSTSKPRQQANTQDPNKNKHLKNPELGDKIVSTKRDAHFASPPQQQSNPQELQQQANTQVQSKSKHLVNQEPGRKMVNSESVIPPDSHPQQQSMPQEPSGSKCLESDQPGDSTVVLKRVTDESKQSASVPIPKPQQQSKPEEPIGSKHQKQSNLQEPPSGNGGVESEQPGGTNVGSKRVTDESQQSATDSASLSSFNVTWQVLESHFVSQTSSLQSNLELLQCQQKSPFIISSSPVPGPARPDLKSLCEKMKGLGVRNYIMERLSEIITIRDELQDALRCSRDPAGLVLVALEGFHDASPMGNENSECDRRWCYVVLLEALAALMPEIGGGLKEKVKKLAEEWQKKTNVGVESSLDCLGFLYLVAAYRLADSFDMDVLIDFSCVVVKDLEFEQAVQLCRFLNLNIQDLISRLETVNEKLVAVIIHEFKLTDKFPPVPIPNEHQLSKKRSRSQLIEMQTNAATKEVNSLKPVIEIESLEKAVEMQNCAETLKPQQQSNTQYPNQSKQIENHEPCDKMVNTERFIPPPASFQPQEPSGSKSLGSGRHQPGDTTVGSNPEEAPSGSKRQKQSNQQEPPSGNGSVKSDQPGVTTVGSNPQLGGSKPPSAEQVGHKVVISNFSAIPQSNLQPAAPAPIGTVAHLQQPGQWPAAHPGSFAGSPAGPYSWGGSYPNVNPNNGYVLPPHHQLGHGFGIPGNLRPPGPHVYPPELYHPPAGYFPVPPHNGYGFPPNYHQR